MREALHAGLAPTRAAELHRRSARHLAHEGAEPETVAAHWRLAGDDKAAWPFVLRAAQRLRERGEHDAAQAALRELRAATRDDVLALRAEIMLAQEHLFDDLDTGRRALDSVRVRAGQLPPGAARQTIEATRSPGWWTTRSSAATWRVPARSPRPCASGCPGWRATCWRRRTRC